MESDDELKFGEIKTCDVPLSQVSRLSRDPQSAFSIKNHDINRGQGLVHKQSPPRYQEPQSIPGGGLFNPLAELSDDELFCDIKTSDKPLSQVSRLSRDPQSAFSIKNHDINRGQGLVHKQSPPRYQEPQSIPEGDHFNPTQH